MIEYDQPALFIGKIPSLDDYTIKEAMIKSVAVKTAPKAYGFELEPAFVEVSEAFAVFEAAVAVFDAAVALFEAAVAVADLVEAAEAEPDSVVEDSESAVLVSAAVATVPMGGG